MSAEQNDSNEFSSKFLSTFLSLEKESDRGCVIVAAALTEDLLDQCLNCYLLPAINNRDELLNGPSSSFSSKIELCYRVGILRKEIRRLLNTLRKLRNEFAHSSHEEGFRKDSVKNHIESISNISSNLMHAAFEILNDSNNLSLGFEIPKNESEITKVLIENIGYRKVFQIAISLNISGLLITLEQIEPVLPLAE